MRITCSGGTAIGFRVSRRRILAGLILVLISSCLNAAPTAYTDETEYHDALALLGLTATHEGFEDDAAWGSVRSTIPGGFHTAASVSNLGVTWTANYLAGNITTGGGAARTGNWGLYAYPHGGYASPDPGSNCSVPGECGDGWRGTADSGVFIAVGGYIDTNTPYAKLGMFIGQYPDNPVDFGETCDAGGNNCVSNSTIGTAKVFFGVIDPDGFSAFEYRELEGTAEDMKLVFADDFFFVITETPAPTFTVGGTVNGLSGSGLVLQNNTADDLAIAGDGGFAFATALPDGNGYDVTVLTQPVGPNQTCTVANGSGTLSGANVTDVGVTCVTSCNVNTVSGVIQYSDAAYEACEILVLGPDFVAADGSNVSASSGWEIEFLAGFHIERGATLDANVCGQSLCMVSDAPMPYGCHSCVVQVCDIDPTCCSLDFDQACLDRVGSVCGLACE